MHQLLPSPAELAEHARKEPEFARWSEGYGPFVHSDETRAAAYRMAHQMVQAGLQPDLASVYRLLRSLDRLSAAGLWLVLGVGATAPRLAGLRVAMTPAEALALANALVDAAERTSGMETEID